MSNTVEKRFSEEEFRALLLRASRRCVANARRFYCEGELPEGLLFYGPERDRRVDAAFDPPVLGLPARALGGPDLVLGLAWRADGSHRPDVRLSPEGVTDEATVLRVEVSTDAWTSRVLTGELAVPEEPFLLRGPDLSGDSEAAPGTVPRVRLPRIERRDPAFAWLLAPDECFPLVDADPAVRLETAQLLERRLRQGFRPDECLEPIATAAQEERDALVRRGFAQLLERSTAAAWLAIRRGWLEDRDPNLRASAYRALAEARDAAAFDRLLGLLPGETSERGQVGLVQAFAVAVGHSGERFTRLNVALRGAALSKAARRELAKLAAHFIA